MNVRNTLTKALYLSVGAIALGVEAIGEAADILIEKGEVVVTRGKEMVRDLRTKYDIPDDEEPAVTIETDDEDAIEL
jgi:polyhydroxyalkanoate synthesis regulator phasin